MSSYTSKYTTKADVDKIAKCPLGEDDIPDVIMLAGDSWVDGEVTRGHNISISSINTSDNYLKAAATHIIVYELQIMGISSRGGSGVITSKSGGDMSVSHAQEQPRDRITPLSRSERGGGNFYRMAERFVQYYINSISDQSGGSKVETVFPVVYNETMV
jgi:hypothetical protein